MLQLLIAANVSPGYQIHITLMMEMMRSSETSVFTRTTGRNIPEDVNFSISINVALWRSLECSENKQKFVELIMHS